jgi:RecA/RadA recombinase
MEGIVTKPCEQCKAEFEPKNPKGKYCSDKCRKAASRKAGVDSETGEILATQEKPAVAEGAYDREKNLQAFIKMGLQKVEWVSTGLADFDALTKIPRGRITQIQGPYGVGKTTLCLNMIRGMKGVKVLYIDSEASLNPELLADLEVSSANFTLYNESAYFEDIAEVIRSAAKSGVYDVVIFDSLASTTTKAEAEGDITASNIGQKAKLMHKLIHLTQMDFKNTDTAFVVINQEREMIGTYVPTKYTPGGNAVPYAASLIVALKTIKSWRFPKDPKNGLYQGHEVEATIIKSKVNQPWRTAKFKLYYPHPVAVKEGVLSDVEPF